MVKVKVVWRKFPSPKGKERVQARVEKERATVRVEKEKEIARVEKEKVHNRPLRKVEKEKEIVRVHNLPARKVEKERDPVRDPVRDPNLPILKAEKERAVVRVAPSHLEKEKVSLNIVSLLHQQNLMMHISQYILFSRLKGKGGLPEYYNKKTDYGDDERPAKLGMMMSRRGLVYSRTDGSTLFARNLNGELLESGKGASMSDYGKGDSGKGNSKGDSGKGSSKGDSGKGSSKGDSGKGSSKGESKGSSKGSSKGASKGKGDGSKSTKSTKSQVPVFECPESTYTIFLHTSNETARNASHRRAVLTQLLSFLFSFQSLRKRASQARMVMVKARARARARAWRKLVNRKERGKDLAAKVCLDH